MLTCEVPGEGFPDLEETNVQKVPNCYSAEWTEDVCEPLTLWIEDDSDPVAIVGASAECS
jgi:hypothetical protein